MDFSPISFSFDFSELSVSFLQVLTKPFKTVNGIIPFCNLIFSLKVLLMSLFLFTQHICELWRGN